MDKQARDNTIDALKPAGLTLSRRTLLKSSVVLPVLGVGPSTFGDEQHYLPPEAPSEWHAYLTETERQHPLAKYWYRFTPIAEDVLDDLARGSMNPADRLVWEDRLRLSESGDHKVENGYCALEDGSHYVAIRTRFPGCTARMIDWWFVWAQREEIIRYKIWNPGAHFSMSELPTPSFDRRPGDKTYWGMSRFPVEDVGMGVTQMRLDFVRPEAFGFDSVPAGGTVLCVRVGIANGWLKHTDMIHHVRVTPDGVEMRSRFWMARDFEAMAGGTSIAAMMLDVGAVKRRLLTADAARGMAYHCATEYSQLAGFLPELYDIYGQEPV